MASMHTFHGLDVYHHARIVDSYKEDVAKSINTMISDEGYALLGSKMFIVYLPSEDCATIGRTEYDMYLSIDSPGDVIKSFNSVEFEINETNISKVLSSIHMQKSDVLLHYPPQHLVLD